MLEGSQNELTYLSSKLSKMIKQKFGKGPGTCFSFEKDGFLFFYMRHFITPAEEVLMEKNNVNLLHSFRTTIIEAIVEEFSTEMSTLFNREYQRHLHDWNYETNTGVLMFINSNKASSSGNDKMNMEGLQSHIHQISMKNHKIPEQVYLMKMNANITVIECAGTILDVEKQLYKQGYMDILYDRTKKIYDSYYQYKKRFEVCFNRLIEDQFVLWDYHGDKNYLFFYFKAE